VFYRRALSSAEVTEVYQAGGRGRCSDDLVVSTTGLDSEEMFPNDKVLFAVNVANYGSNKATDVRLTNELPQNLRIVSAASSQGSVAFSSNEIIANLGDINPGVQVSVAVSARAQSAGIGTNIAYAARKEDELNLLNNKAVSVVTIFPECAQLPSGS